MPRVGICELSMPRSPAVDVSAPSPTVKPRTSTTKIGTGCFAWAKADDESVRAAKRIAPVRTVEAYHLAGRDMLLRMSSLVSLAAIRSAAARIAGIAHKTPALDVSELAGRPLVLKCEPLQPGGAFKIRGA